MVLFVCSVDSYLRIFVLNLPTSFIVQTADFTAELDALLTAYCCIHDVLHYYSLVLAVHQKEIFLRISTC